MIYILSELSLDRLDLVPRSEAKRDKELIDPVMLDHHERCSENVRSRIIAIRFINLLELGV